jgi:hypothetical protein
MLRRDKHETRRSARDTEPYPATHGYCGLRAILEQAINDGSRSPPQFVPERVTLFDFGDGLVGEDNLVPDALASPP